jgi:hypothetical protein
LRIKRELNKRNGEGEGEEEDWILLAEYKNHCPALMEILMIDGVS